MHICWVARTRAFRHVVQLEEANSNIYIYIYTYTELRMTVAVQASMAFVAVNLPVTGTEEPCRTQPAPAKRSAASTNVQLGVVALHTAPCDYATYILGRGAV